MKHPLQWNEEAERIRARRYAEVDDLKSLRNQHYSSSHSLFYFLVNDLAELGYLTEEALADPYLGRRT